VLRAAAHRLLIQDQTLADLPRQAGEMGVGGNRTRREHVSTREVTEYEWEFRNRLVRVTERDQFDAITQVVEFIYDVTGGSESSSTPRRCPAR
jgi:hypothetical protein